MGKQAVDLLATRRSLWRLLAPESKFLNVVIIYGLAISLMTLAVPIAVQTLINTIANIGSMRAVVVLSITLCLLLLVSGVLSALRLWIVELYERRVYARLTAEMSYRLIRAPHDFFEGRRNAGMTHRYFDIMILQKNVPRLMVDGFTLVLQMLVGFTLVSFYHESLFLFNVIVIVVMYAIWRIWAYRAKKTALELSRSKYVMAKWLSDVEVAHEFFKASRHADLAAQTTDANAKYFIESHGNHFRYTFTQAVMFLLLSAFGSAALLGLGGWLVSRGELSIGQLVAAELIMATIFQNLSRFVSYLKSYYELYGAADKITELLSVPQEPDVTTRGAEPTSGDLEFHNVQVRRGHKICQVDLALHSGQKVFVQASEAWIQRKVLNAIRYHETPEAGWITLGGKSLVDLDQYEVRQVIHSIDRNLIAECSIMDFLRLSAPDAGTHDIMTVLHDVRLWSVVEQFPDGLDTRLSVLGAPFQSVEVLLLKLAAAILAHPKVLVLNQRFDNVLGHAREHIMQVLEQQPFTVLYFTSYPDNRFFDGCLQLTLTDNDSEAQGND